MRFVIVHIPHIIPVVAIWGILLKFWLAQRRLEAGREPAPSSAPVAAAVPAPRPAKSTSAPVRRRVASRALVALGPLIGALATGLVIYALNLGSGHAGTAAIWVHVGISMLALLLVVYKLAEIGQARLRQSLTHARVLRSGGSLLLLVLWVPLLISGVALVIAPSAASFTAYAHLIASVWWTGLLLWHLRRYLARATRAVLARPQPAPRQRASAVAAQRVAPRRDPTAARPEPHAEPEPAGVAADDGAAAPAHSG